MRASITVSATGRIRATPGTAASARSPRPALAQRVAVAVAIGGASGLLCWAFIRRPGYHADFIYPWTAARALLAGENPYHVLSGGLAEPFQAPLFYPLPAVIAALPLAVLPFAPAGALFFSLSAALLAFAVTSDGWARLPLFASGPFIVAASLAQWSPLVMAAALLPGMEWLGVTKPNLGVALAAYRPRWRALAGAVAVLAGSVVLVPGWPHDWARSIAFDRAHAMHPIPLLLELGPLLALAAMRWRTADGRLLLALSLVPQKLFFYDQLPLALVARTARESLAFAAVTGGAALIWVMTTTAAARERTAVPYVMLAVYLPALVLVLRRRAVSAGGAPSPRSTRARARSARGEGEDAHRGDRLAPAAHLELHLRAGVVALADHPAEHHAPARAGVPEQLGGEGARGVVALHHPARQHRPFGIQRILRHADAQERHRHGPLVAPRETAVPHGRGDRDGAEGTDRVGDDGEDLIDVRPGSGDRGRGSESGGGNDSEQ
ncbi:MAG TPA: hypothetical protein VF041_18110 [Gemmatimonadaceae bacterium]